MKALRFWKSHRRPGVPVGFVLVAAALLAASIFVGCAMKENRMGAAGERFQWQSGDTRFGRFVQVIKTGRGARGSGNNLLLLGHPGVGAGKNSDQSRLLGAAGDLVRA